MFKVAVAQLNSGKDIRQNLSTALSIIEESASCHADMVVLPENFLYIGADKTVVFDVTSPELNEIKQKAQQCSCYVLAGSFPEKNVGTQKHFNTSLLFDSRGEVLGCYRKIHLFDVELGDSPEFNESSYVVPGDKPVTIKTPLATMGMSICYDLRFPELYRHLALMGAEIAFVPSNFALHTGKDHWQVLLRARAIENGMYIVAANQIGTKYDGNISYGRSCIIDPWGIPIAQASDTAPALIYANIDLEYVKQVRSKIPTLDHIKLFTLPSKSNK